jgi:hypothetical protein
MTTAGGTLGEGRQREGSVDFDSRESRSAPHTSDDRRERDEIESEVG